MVEPLPRGVKNFVVYHEYHDLKNRRPRCPGSAAAFGSVIIVPSPFAETEKVPVLLEVYVYAAVQVGLPVASAAM